MLSRASALKARFIGGSLHSLEIGIRLWKPIARRLKNANRETNKQTRLSLGLGLVALKLEQPEMAVAALQEAAQSEPFNDRVQRGLSDAYLTNGLANDAFQAAKTALDLAPSDINTLTWFIEQGAKIAEQPGFARQTVRSEMVRVLRLALQQAPSGPIY